MTKVSAVRSVMRRMALTKVADEYSDMLNGYANAHRPGITGAGVRTAVNSNLRASGYKPAPAPASKATPAPQPAKPATSGFRISNPLTAKGGLVSDTKDLFRAIANRVRGNATPRPVVGASTPIVTR